MVIKINKKYQCSNFFLCQKLKSRVSFIELKPILGHFLAWFQSLQLPSTQSESPLALIPLAPKSHVSFKARTQPRRAFFIFPYFDPD
jgi:hypothetical protein